MLGKFTRINEAKQIVIDIETKDRLLKDKGAGWVFNDGYILGISVKIDDLPSEYYPMAHLNEANYDKDGVYGYIRDIMLSNIPKIGHFLYYDIGWINHELKPEFQTIPMLEQVENFRDTLLEAQLYHNTLSSHSLAAMAEHFKIGQKMDVKGDDIWKQPIWLIEKYACNDTDLTYEIDKKMLLHINQEALERECKLIPILVQMKQNGIKVNEEKLQLLKQEWKSELYNIINELPIKDIWQKTSLVNLFNYLGLSYYKTSTGQPSFTKSFLESINHPLIQKLVKARQLDRLIGTFLKGVTSHLEDGKIHPDYFNGRSEFGGTVLGRFSSAHPNIQQVPQRDKLGLQVKELFVPNEANDIFGRWDYSQQEPRLSIHYASLLYLEGINEWVDRYNKDPNSDCYIPVTQQMDIERQEAKVIWLAVSYGMGPRHMSELLGCEIETATEHLNNFYKAVPWIKPLINHCIRKTEERGYIITIGKRKLYFDKSFGYKAMNGLIQGSAADQTKQAMLDIYDRTKKIPLIQVHDELDYEFTENEYVDKGIDLEISQSMKEAFVLNIPSKIDFTMGRNWKECCEK